MFLEEGFLSHTLNHAKVLKKDKGVEISCTKESLQRFCCYQLGSGISRIAREGLLFQRNDVHGLLHNEFLSTIITHDELVKYKKIYVGDRSKMTEIFNKTSAKYWKPYQKIGFDEGGIPAHIHSDELSYVPGKPHPNMLEYLAAVDSEGFCVYLVWEKGSSQPKI